MTHPNTVVHYFPYLNTAAHLSPPPRQKCRIKASNPSIRHETLHVSMERCLEYQEASENWNAIPPRIHDLLDQRPDILSA
jgi:hypothetical protein